MSKPQTLAAIINETAAGMLEAIVEQYKDKLEIEPTDYQVMLQSCTKLMEISTKILSKEAQCRV